MKSIGLREGGWVLLIAAALFAAIIIWALAPAVLRMTDRPPGDGHRIETYLFDLSNKRLPDTADIEPAMLHRDMVPVLDAPLDIHNANDILSIADSRAKYLVSQDTIVGVTINDETRAYPISMLNVHEMVHDELGGVPILVTWHWPSASPRVFDRRIDGHVRMFGVSGLMAGGNLAFYPRHEDLSVGGEPLYSQLLGRTITGTAHTLTPIPSTFTDWKRWHTEHPDTTVAGRDPALKKRYKHAAPDAYYHSGGLISQSLPPEGGPPPKSPVLIIGAPAEIVVTRVNDQWSQNGPWELRGAGAGAPPRVECPTCNPTRDLRHGLWHSVHSLGFQPSNH